MLRSTERILVSHAGVLPRPAGLQRLFDAGPREREAFDAALPGAVATVAFLAGLRAFSTLVFEPLIASNAATYGAVGTVLILQSWLIGVGWVIYGGQLFGRWFYDGWLRAQADSRRIPGDLGGEQGEQAPGDPSTPPL